ncbi:MAG: hypothetical protein IJ236_06650 [Oscillospiraceae bacterium]|nr:hypothetical protein [Oscillospiraceae bacterium]
MEDDVPEDRQIVEQLRSLHTGEGGDPVYQGTFTFRELPDAGRLSATLIWEKQHVLFFLDELSEDYTLAKNSGWYCYCTTDQMDVQEMLHRIGEK